MVYSYQTRILLLSLIMLYSLLPCLSLSAGVATTRATKIGTNMCLSYLMNVRKVPYFQ